MTRGSVIWDAEYVRGRVFRIGELGERDPEMAHVGEDDLHRDLLAWFAAVAPEPFNELAREALRTGEFKFERWYA